jgi:outer membrane immunogenic protein
MNFVALAAAFALAVTAAPVLAQDASTPFSGPRIEGRIGWDRPDIRVTLTDGTDRLRRSAGKSGVTYGGEIGYDQGLGSLVLGAYAGIEGASAKECGELIGNDRACLRAGRNIAAGVRAGTQVAESFMLYGKGGYSNGRASVDYRNDDLIVADINEGHNFDGFHLGAGVEAVLSNRVYGRLEYVYANYGSERERLEDVTGTLKPSRHQVVYGLGVRF